MISSLADGVMHDEQLEMDGQLETDGLAQTFIIDEVLNCLEDHLDEEGLEMMNIAFEKYEKEYSLQVQTEDIINSLEWNIPDDMPENEDDGE